jgi:hypothetical protein
MREDRSARDQAANGSARGLLMLARQRQALSSTASARTAPSGSPTWCALWACLDQADTLITDSGLEASARDTLAAAVRDLVVVDAGQPAPALEVAGVG